MAIAKDFCRTARVQASLRTHQRNGHRELSFDHASGRSIAIALFRSYLFTVLHFQQTLFSAPCIYTSNWFTCVCVFPCTCRRLTDGDQVSPEKGNSFFFSLFLFTFFLHVSPFFSKRLDIVSIRTMACIRFFIVSHRFFSIISSNVRIVLFFLFFSFHSFSLLFASNSNDRLNGNKETKRDWTKLPRLY